MTAACLRDGTLPHQLACHNEGAAMSARSILIVSIACLALIPSVARGQARRVDAVRICSAFPGADAGARIAACVADLPAAGGTADARGLEGAQAVARTIVLD